VSDSTERGSLLILLLLVDFVALLSDDDDDDTLLLPLGIVLGGGFFPISRPRIDILSWQNIPSSFFGYIPLLLLAKRSMYT
jgi:hypothetical protein